jgi:aminoglycoside/choline kinase family phosphotransferase
VLPPGTVVGGRFVLLGELGRGGMATVYLATDKLRGESAALKLLHPHLSDQPSMRARLRRELEASSRLDHPNILVARELHELEEGLALSMPLHAGRSLQERVTADGPLSAEELWRLGAGLADALAHAHRAGVIHRDITPRNIMINDQGDAVLLDFGLARLDSQRSRGTQVIITPGFAAPEAVTSGRAEPRADLYSLGAVLAFAATGAPLFGEGSALQILRRQESGERTPLHRARRDLPLEWCEIVEGMLEPDPAARPQGASAVAMAFAEQRAPPRITQSALATLPSSTPLALPEGDWVVRISERDGDARRRGRLRRARSGAVDIESVVVGALASAGRRLMTALSLPQPRTPEERLVAAVAQSAGLPEDALEAPSALLERDLVLLSGVDEQTARDVSRVAQEVGFNVELTASPPDLRSSRGYAIAMLTAFMMLGVGAGLLLSGAGPLMLWSALVALIVLWRAVPHRPALPEAAFDRELLAHLSPRYRLEAPEATEVTETPPMDPVTALQQRALSQIAELDSLLSHAPEVVAQDLRETLSALRWQAEELGTKSVILQSLRADGGVDAAAAAVERVSSRLSRLQALARAGEPVSMSEVRSLEAALTAHQETLAEQEEAEAELTAVMAHYLEIGATVAHCRRVLSTESASDAAERDGALARLREEVQRVSRAQEELSALSQRRRAGQLSQRSRLL